LFGPVSISADYSDAARQLIVEFLRERRFRADLAHWVAPRRPFRSRVTRAAELRAVAACVGEVEDLSARINDIDEHSGVPVLLRHYLRLGGRVAAFHVDRNFSDTLDGLLIVDLREAPPKLLAKYVGSQKFRPARDGMLSGETYEFQTDRLADCSYCGAWELSREVRAPMLRRPTPKPRLRQCSSL